MNKFLKSFSSVTDLLLVTTKSFSFCIYLARSPKMAPLSLRIVSDEGAVTRTVKFESHTKVRDACAVIREKMTAADDGKDYALFLTSADDDRAGVWLEPHRRLDYYMLRDGDSLLYLSKLRNLRIRMLDDSLKTLQVDESKNVGDLMITICSKIGITNHDEYGLCHEEEDAIEEPKEKENKPATGTLTLKRKAQQRDRDTKMELLSKKLKTDDNVEWLDQHRTLREQGVDPTVTVLLKRRLFFSDRNVDSRDPVQLNLLYVQTRDAILNGRHSVTESQAQDCKTRWIHMRDVYRRILRKALNSGGKRIQFYKYHKELAFIRPYFRDLYDSDNNSQEIDFCDDQDYDNNGVGNDNPENGKGANESDDSESSDEEQVVKRRATRKSMKRETKTPQQQPICQDKTISFSTQDIPLTSTLDPNDEIDSFVLYVSATLKKLTPYHLNLAKSKIFSIVQEYELQMIVDNPLNTEHNYSLNE